MQSLPVPDLYALLMRVRQGGAIVAVSSCGLQEVALAHAEKRIFYDKDGFGYLYRPKEAQR